ncbi:DSCAM [Mytilus coruscus]|uniref:DSCAM n=1 Tax=Mytilus coruscus TaxID=42192 RepID=A0A6J8ALQ7_MYTCO|nr:DSCAM [Mytilus coruscus]
MTTESNDSVRYLRWKDDQSSGYLSLSTKCISYAKIGKTATLKCLVQTVDRWDAGIVTKNSTTYALKRIVNEKLQIAKRLSVSEEYSLIIKNVSRSDFQIYRCTGYKDSKLETYDIVLNERIDPSNIRILEETEPHRVIGVVGQNMSITCTVTSGEPKETLKIKDDKGREITKGGPGSVKLQLKPDHNDDGRNFTCLVISCDEQVLSYTVQLHLRCKYFTVGKKICFIVDKPNITIQAYPFNTIMEGNPLELRCNDQEGSNNVISGYKWEHNGTHLQHSLKVMQLNVTTRKNNGNFTCTAENKAGETRDTIEINILYAPTIENYSVSFFKNNSNLFVKCTVSGNPTYFTYGVWIHFSDVDAPIRHLNGSENGRLAISSLTGSGKAYENGGVYVCYVSNGIRSTDGSLWQTGKIHVTIKESPVFTRQSKSEQVGYIDNTSSLSVDVMSSSKIMSTTWYKERSEVLKTEQLTMTRKSLIIKAQFHNKMVYTKGYRCDLVIDQTKPEDFHNYTVTVQNQYGFSSFTIQLRYAGPPRMPQITSLERTPYAILVKWEPGFDGGHRTTYEIEYQKVTEIKWDRIHIKENNLNKFLIADPNTDYLVRMKALNKMGHSSFTKEHTVFTEEYTNHHMGSKKSIAIFVMLLFLCIMAVAFGLRYTIKNRRCFGRYKDRVTPLQRNEETSVIPGQYDEIDSMYYNPINNTISSQNQRNNAELGIHQLSNRTDNFENDDTNSSSYQSITTCTVHQVKSSQENYSARSLTDESYLLPCRMSNLSDNSETNIKSIQRYETLNFSDIKENMYTTYNVSDT